MIKYPYLLVLEAFENQCKAFKKKYKNEISKEIKEKNRRHISKQFSKIKESYLVTVWCRNGDICNKATHCMNLDCKYKPKKEDVEIGISLCENFQLTMVAEKWGSAIHIAPFGSVDVYSL